MKTIFNVFFEKLHRYIFDYHYQSKNTDFGLPSKYSSANRHNKLERHNKNIAKFYNLLCPYFVGWRENLVKKYPNKVEYKRYQ